MSEPFRPEADDDEPPDPAAEPDAAAELRPGGPLTEDEHLLVREAEWVIDPCAKRIAGEFPRIVREDGLVTLGDLHNIGYEALVRAARAFDPKRSDDFTSFARHIVRYRMLNLLGDLLYEERLKHAAIRAEEHYSAFFFDPDYDVMKHDGQEARRRYRAFLNGLMTATFMATTEAARKSLDAAETELQREYEQAIALLRRALTCLSEQDRQLLALMYRDHVLLKDAAERLGLPYGTARAHHSRALRVLHDLLVEHNITRAPRPLVVPPVGDLLDAPVPPAQNDTDPGVR